MFICLQLHLALARMLEIASAAIVQHVRQIIHLDLTPGHKSASLLDKN